MALDPIEWIVIGVIVVVVLMWGPSKIPEFARAIGRARKEIDSVKKEVGNPTDALLQAPPPSGARAPQASSDDLLIMTARRMGITTEGKTREQITSEMVAATTPTNQGTPK